MFIGDGIKKKSIIERVKKENISNCYFIPFLKKSDLALILNNVADVGLMNLENIKEFEKVLPLINFLIILLWVFQLFVIILDGFQG